MIDKHGRQITYLRISLTDRCNFACLYCMPPEKMTFLPREKLLSFEQVVTVVEGAVTVGISKIRLTGGEPLVRQNVPDLVRLIRAVPGVESVVMTTNASLLAPHAVALREAGLERLNISIDSLQPERFRAITKGGNLKPVLAGIDAAIDAGFTQTKLNMVVMRGENDDEIEAMVDFARAKNLELRFLERMPFNSAHESWASYFLPVTEIYERVRQIDGLVPEKVDQAGGPAEMYRFRNSGCRIGFIAALSNPFCESCNRLRVSSTGTIRSCLVDGGEIDFREAIQNGAGPAEVGQLLRTAADLKPLTHSKKQDVHMSRVGG